MHAKGNEWTVGPTSAPDLPNFGDAGGVAHADSHNINEMVLQYYKSKLMSVNNMKRYANN